MTDLRPTVGSDRDTWGTKLLSWLGVSLNTDGTLVAAKVAAALPSSVDSSGVLLPAAVRTAIGGSIPVSLTGAVGDGVTDDTAAIQAVLTANNGLGSIIKGTTGKTYLISSPLVIYSNTTLDMTGCTVKLKTGSSCRMLQTSNTTGGRAVADGVMTAASATLTSATAVFSAADVGKSVTVAGAGPGMCLFTTISAFTNSTTVTLATTAYASVSGANVDISDRNTDIYLRGGLWDRQNNGGAAGTDRHSIVLRRVDRCAIRDASFASTGGKFAVLFQSCTEFYAQDLWMRVTSSDGVHIEGPAARGYVKNIRGDCGDDMVAMTALDWTGYTWGGEGDITDIVIDTVQGYTSTTNLVAIYGGLGLNTRRVTVRNVEGSCLGSPVVVGDNAGNANTVGGLLDEISISDIHGVASHNSGNVVNLNATNGKRATVRDITWVAGTFTSQNAVTATNWDRLHVSGVQCIDGGASAGSIVAVEGTITDLLISDVTGSPVSGFRSVMALDPAVASASVTRAFLSRISLVFPSGGNFAYAPTSGQVLGTLRITDCHGVAPAWICDLNTATTVILNSVTTTSAANGSINCRAASNIKVYGNIGTQSMINGSVATTAGYALQVNNPTFPVDISLITGQSVGDRAHNSQSATTPGSGPVSWDGSRWIFIGLNPTVAPTYSASITPVASKGTWQTITVTNGSAFTINAPTSPPAATQTQSLAIEILNSSGGAMGLITWNAAFIFNGVTWVNPASTKKRVARFEWNGAAWICVSPVGADY